MATGHSGIRKKQQISSPSQRRDTRTASTAQNLLPQGSSSERGVIHTSVEPVRLTQTKTKCHEDSGQTSGSRGRKRNREVIQPVVQCQKRQRVSRTGIETFHPRHSPSNVSRITRWASEVAQVTINTPEDQRDYLQNVHRFLAEKDRKRSSSSIRSSSQGDQGYQDARYATVLETHGIFMKEYRGRLPEEAVKFNDEIREVLEKKQEVPRDSLFSDDSFEDTMEMIQDRNKAFIIETISQLMFPHVQAMAVRGAKNLRPFIQSFDEGWNSCKKITQTRPKPDSAIGFRASEFSAAQLEKLQPYLGDLDAKSDFKATFYMYFPFLTYEVKHGNAGLDIADRQNAHSMTIAVRGLVALFRLAKKEQEIHGKILTMSFSFNHRMVRIYGYLPIIKGQDTEVWREEIDAFDFRTRKGKDKWKCLQYSLNALDIGLQLLEWIRAAIDGWTPDPELEALRPYDTEFPRTVATIL